MRVTRPQLECDTIAHVSTIAAAAMCPIVVAAVSSRAAANAVSSARLVGAAGRVVFGEAALAPLVQDFGSRYQAAAADAEQSKAAALALTSPPMRPDPAAPDFLLKLVTRCFPLLIYCILLLSIFCEQLLCNIRVLSLFVLLSTVNAITACDQSVSKK